MNKKLIVACVAILVALGLIFGSLIAADSTKAVTPAKTEVKAPAKPEAKAASKYDYVGAQKCKICHKNEYDSWMTTVHAKAMDSLKADDQKNAVCLGCHTTGKDAARTVLTGVQCEACHGAGSAYKTPANMKDVKLALANGMTMPTKEVCVKCHNEKSPTFKGFDFDKYVKNEKGIHKHFPKKTEEKKG